MGGFPDEARGVISCVGVLLALRLSLVTNALAAVKRLRARGGGALMCVSWHPAVFALGAVSLQSIGDDLIMNTLGLRGACHGWA